MPLEGWITLAVTLGCVLAMAVWRKPPDLSLLTGLTLLMALDVVGVRQALSGFANEGTLAVAALFVVAAGLRETGALAWLVDRLFRRPKSLLAAQARMMLPVTVLSAFLNNTPVVATFIPAVTDWAKKQRISVSKLMMPLSFAAIFGGSVTIIGTSTNLVVNGLLHSTTSLPGFGFFELAWVGLPCAVIGTLYVFVAQHWLLPERLPPMEQMQDPREYTVEMLVEEHSPLEGLTVEQAGLRHLPGLYLVEIDRDGQVFGAVSPNHTLKGGDRLVFAGITESVIDLQRIKGLKPATNQVFKLESPRPARTLIEAVVARNSAVTGKTVKQGRFRQRYNAVVIAVARDGRRIQRKIGDIRLRPGDTLLLEADSTFVERHRNARDFLLLRPIDGAPVPRRERSWLAWLVLVGMVLLASFRVVPLVTAAFIGAVGMVLTRCCSGNVARRSIELDVVLVIAAAFGLGQALESSGAAEAVAGGLMTAAGDNPIALLVAIYASTVLLTTVVTNNAAAVLIFPLALASAQSSGLHFMPFAVSIAIAASASFATPISYQTNLMVYGPGGYRFSDYLRFGMPLNIVVAVTALFIIPHVWPLSG